MANPVVIPRQNLPPTSVPPPAKAPFIPPPPTPPTTPAPTPAAPRPRPPGGVGAGVGAAILLDLAFPQPAQSPGAPRGPDGQPIPADQAQAMQAPVISSVNPFRPNQPPPQLPDGGAPGVEYRVFVDRFRCDDNGCTSTSFQSASTLTSDNDGNKVIGPLQSLYVYMERFTDGLAGTSNFPTSNRSRVWPDGKSITYVRWTSANGTFTQRINADRITITGIQPVTAPPGTQPSPTPNFWPGYPQPVPGPPVPLPDRNDEPDDEVEPRRFPFFAPSPSPGGSPGPSPGPSPTGDPVPVPPPQPEPIPGPTGDPIPQPGTQPPSPNTGSPPVTPGVAPPNPIRGDATPMPGTGPDPLDIPFIPRNPPNPDVFNPPSPNETECIPDDPCIQELLDRARANDGLGDLLEDLLRGLINDLLEALQQDDLRPYLDNKFSNSANLVKQAIAWANVSANVATASTRALFRDLPGFPALAIGNGVSSYQIIDSEEGNSPINEPINYGNSSTIYSELISIQYSANQLSETSNEWKNEVLCLTVGNAIIKRVIDFSAHEQYVVNNIWSAVNVSRNDDILAGLVNPDRDNLLWESPVAVSSIFGDLIGESDVEITFDVPNELIAPLDDSGESNDLVSVSLNAIKDIQESEIDALIDEENDKTNDLDNQIIGDEFTGVYGELTP